MSQKTTTTIGPDRSFTEAVVGALDNAETKLVSLDATGHLVLFTGTAPAIGVVVDKIQPGAPDVHVRLFSQGGTLAVTQAAAITPGSTVYGTAASTVTGTAGTGNLATPLGTKLGHSAGAAGDIIEIA
jgi:hypothetical protein